MRTWRGLRSISLRAPATMWSAPPSRSTAALSTPIPASRATGGIHKWANSEWRIASGEAKALFAATRHSLASRLDLHILEIARLVVDANLGRRDPGGEFARGRHRRHQ